MARARRLPLRAHLRAGPRRSPTGVAGAHEVRDRAREVGVGVAFGPFAGFPKVIVVTADFFGPI
jgi:hypothetical protein